MDTKEVEKRLVAAQELLTAGSVSPATLASLRTLLHGINPRIDATLEQAAKAFGHAHKLAAGELLDLTVEALPEHTETDKKRKKALLLFIKFWHDLKSEVARVRKELAREQQGSDHANGARSPISNILAGAKGPLGLITVIAIGLVALQLTAVEIVVKNVGCDTINPVATVPVKFPGLVLPDQPIAAGGEGVAKLPPVTLTIDGTQRGRIGLRGYGIAYDIGWDGSDINLLFDGKRLNGTVTTINLLSQKHHALTVQCR